MTEAEKINTLALLTAVAVMRRVRIGLWKGLRDDQRTLLSHALGFADDVARDLSRKTRHGLEVPRHTPTADLLDLRADRFCEAVFACALRAPQSGPASRRKVSSSRSPKSSARAKKERKAK
jgi:hypothetical protein